MILKLSHASTLPFLCSLALTEVGFQQFDDVRLNPGSIIAFGELLADIHCPEADFVLLVGFGFPEDLKDSVHGQFPGLAQFLHLNGLGQGRGAVLALHGFQKVLLFLLGQLGQFHSGSEGDFAFIHHI